MLRHLLSQLEIIAELRDRDQLAEVTAALARDLLKADTVLLHRVLGTQFGLTVSPLAWAVDGFASAANKDHVDISDSPLIGDPLIEQCLAADKGMASEPGDKQHRLCLIGGQQKNPSLVLEASMVQLASDEAIDCVRHLLNIYLKHLSMLDYAELDTLTKLNNRKTFDENFDHFIEIAEQANRRDDLDRRHDDEDKAARPCWVGVADIDKFKRINDNFGHLFGDEVLLRVAELMKKSFRTSDKLFRFGGEEFVILLRHVSAENAAFVLDRFRQSVENHEFPQVGQVTCSLGYVKIESNLTPAEILGQADEALYFCKENGRNQINCYTDLIAQGLLQGPADAVDNADLQADIDALFD